MNKNQHEACEQVKLFKWAQFMSGKYPDLELIYHIPNGGSRNKMEAANLKQQGVKAGVPDICLPVPSKTYHGLYIELKYGKNKPTDKQKYYLTSLHRLGYAVVVCYDWQSAAKAICKYLNIKWDF